MATIITINGANKTDEDIRHGIFTELNEYSTNELKRLKELMDNPKARKFLKTDFMFGILKMALNKL